MVSKDARLQELATVTGAFALVCGAVAVVASSVPPPAAPASPEAVEMQKRAEEASAALEERDYERARESIEAMCARVESLGEDASATRSGKAEQDGRPVTLAK